MGVVSPSTEVVLSNSLEHLSLWSASDRPGSQTPRRSCGSVLDPRFRGRAQFDEDGADGNSKDDG